MTLIILDRDMPNVSPVHHTGSEINQVFGVHSEKIRRHKLPDRAIALFPVVTLGLFENWPVMNRLTVLLIGQYLRGQSSLACVFRNRIPERHH